MVHLLQTAVHTMSTACGLLLARYAQAPTLPPHNVGLSWCCNQSSLLTHLLQIRFPRSLSPPPLHPPRVKQACEIHNVMMRLVMTCSCIEHRFCLHGPTEAVSRYPQRTVTTFRWFYCQILCLFCCRLSLMCCQMVRSLL